MTGNFRSESESWPAPAKLNLFLHITGRRADGYHELQSLFQILDYGDELKFSVNRSGLIQRVNRVDNLAEEQDIVVKAARLLAAQSDAKVGVDIQLMKRIPMGGGLGGGSSNAATTLVALNHLWQLHLPMATLMQLGLQLGADVPVFVAGNSAWAEGVGEKLEAVSLPRQYYLVVTPKVHIATAAMFADLNLTRDLEVIKIRDYFSGATQNVFEPLVRKQYQEVAQAMDWLDEQSSDPAKLSGTGASVFIAHDDETVLQKIAESVPSKWPCFVAEGVNRSPLHTHLEKCDVCR